MKSDDIDNVIALLREECRSWQTPAVTVVSAFDKSPFRVLISCIISLRTKDQVTAIASERLFARADTPETMQYIPVEEIARLIYPAGFYHNKARQIREIACGLVADYEGKVPDTVDELLKFKGVGRKTANLVVTLGFGKPGVCVDTHVHRICNRLGYVSTKNPQGTEMALREKLPTEYWLEINDLFVAFGQNHCYPVSPRCTVCKIKLYCERVGVTKFR